MTKILFALGAVLISVGANASTGVLDGKAYCRTVVSDGSMGQPKGERPHCLKFAAGMATDSANTFFGNPPEYAPYRVSRNIVSFGTSQYSISGDGSHLMTVRGSSVAGTVFTLQIQGH